MAAAATVGADMKLLALLLAAASLAPATTFYITVAGLGGEDEYQQRFDNWAKEIDKLVRASNDAQVETLFGPTATKAKIEAALRSVASKARREDALVLMLVGHGTFDGYDYKLNLPGPDITGGELSALLDRIPASRQLVVNTTSCSGGSLKALQRPGRVVVTATKTGTERNATVFARYWVEALRDPAADSDKNETISALEAYRYAEQKTSQFYESQKRLATEHAVLEDTGKGDGVRQPSPQNGQGLAASQFAVLRMAGAQNISNDPAKLALLKQREGLEAKIDKLKYEKASLNEGEYRKQLRALLTELAKVQAELDK
jgi:hypothetical protein